MLTIQDIKRLVEKHDKNNKFFFSPETLRFFRQSLSSFKVERLTSETYLISAPMRGGGKTKRIFDTRTNCLDFVD